MEVKSLIRSLKKQLNRLRYSGFGIGLLSLIWFLFRTGTKPTRAIYPCQRTAAASSYIWFTVYVVPFLLAVPRKISSIDLNRKRALSILALVVVGIGSVVSWAFYGMWSRPPSQVIGLSIQSSKATAQPASDIFVVNGTEGDDGGISNLIDLMGKHNLFFYESPVGGKNTSPTGLIAKNDVVLIKMNSQWDERGGTNTDLLKGLIEAIVNHPDGFIGEIIIADNGQAQAGSTGNGGSLEWLRNNAEDTSQSVQKVADSFGGSYNVSTYLWDTITTRNVTEYSEGDMEDGYVVNTTANPRTGIMVSYPKFKTKFGTYVSFKKGIWDPQRQTYDSEKLKVINVPILKTHSTYGVTACVKHYMGVVSDKLTGQLGARSHVTVGTGGMGTEMVETRFPILNILDAIWVNARPGSGPGTNYNVATRVNVILASTDPVALDYWAAKYILLQVAKIRGYRGEGSMDPENTASGSFGYWLRLSMQEMISAGNHATVDESHMNVYVLHL